MNGTVELNPESPCSGAVAWGCCVLWPWKPRLAHSTLGLEARLRGPGSQDKSWVTPRTELHSERRGHVVSALEEIVHPLKKDAKRFLLLFQGVDYLFWSFSVMPNPVAVARPRACR
ncbi:hypothetical protein PsorP6_012164 [Peronosclerospora sorghi]|uniref:Uncharacterized protein n=1 Tax=Peronosclerospora sorghi TaxID=230839 RepID=A0ACC0WLI9_9STRA|nr:hypothetical protein PsorP6_012164 [Peronosclerospora sorghi]